MDLVWSLGMRHLHGGMESMIGAHGLSWAFAAWHAWTCGPLRATPCLLTAWAHGGQEGGSSGLHACNVHAECGGSEGPALEGDLGMGTGPGAA